MTSVAYLVNQYPKVSHSFIRREIEALEKAGTPVYRLALRGWDAETVDPKDREEQARTTYLLGRTKWRLLTDTLAVALRRPGRFALALKESLRLGRRGDRPIWLYLVYLLEACRLHTLMRAQGIDHVHTHFGTNGTTVAMLASLLGDIGYSFTVHGPEEFDKPEFIHLTEKINRARFVVAITSFCRSQLYRWCDVSQWPKIQVVRCGLEPDFHTLHVTDVPDVPQLLCIGRLCEQKGQLLLIHAAAELKARGQHFKLVLAGDGEMRPAIESLIREHGLEDMVQITGWISSGQVRELLLASRAMVLPSFAEGLPVVIMEALALQRPVITTQIAGIPELVKGGHDGWLITAGSVPELVDAMSSALNTPVETLRQYGAHGRTLVTQLHDVDHEAGVLARLFSTPSSF
jgi:colanic acid/amylovoran biosynthesis glycosyltransferase